MGMPWVKLYTEFLDDAKVGRLDRSTRLLFLELVMLAGDCDAEGYLITGAQAMTETDIAWRLRLPTDDVALMLHELVQADLVKLYGDGYCVAHFQERQGRTQSEKRELWRERKRQQRDRAETPQDVTRDEKNVTGESRGSHGGVTLLEGEEKKEEREEAKVELPHSPTPKHVQNSTPQAVKVFRENAHRYPAKSWYAKIDTTVGENRPDLDRWGETVHAWVGLGWNPTNVKGMLEYYQRGQIPGEDGRMPMATGPPPQQTPTTVSGLKTMPGWIGNGKPNDT